MRTRRQSSTERFVKAEAPVLHDGFVGFHKTGAAASPDAGYRRYGGESLRHNMALPRFTAVRRRSCFPCKNRTFLPPAFVAPLPRPPETVINLGTGGGEANERFDSAKGRNGEAKGAPPSMIEIFAIVFCVTVSDPKWQMANQCRVLNAGTFQTLGQCERQRLAFSPALEKQFTVKGKTTVDVRCYKRTVRPDWEPAE